MGNFHKYNLYFANSCKQTTILFVLIGLLFISSFPSAVGAELRSYTCTNASANAKLDTFWENFVSVMTDLVTNAPQTGFNISSGGQSPNIIYGLLQCSENISEEDCSMCSRQALDDLMNLCGHSVGGQVWFDQCFLRYDNYTFFSKLDTDGSYLENVNDISTNHLKSFMNTTFNLLSNLSDKAYVHANKGFAEGSVAYSSVGTVYGLVQCWRDISIKDCRSCLQSAMNNLYNCCSTKQGGQAMLGSCTVRYEIYPFFNTSTGSNTSTSPPANPPKGAAQTPRPNGGSNTSTSSPANPLKGAAQTPRPNGKSGSSKRLPIILGIVGGVVLALVVSLFSMRRKLKSAISRRPATRPQNEDIHENYSESTVLKQKQIMFTFDALIESTGNFHENNKLGGGGFGSVYKGNTTDGKQIAVKKLSGRSSQGNDEFRNEVKVLANVRHRNLVKLLGCCAEGPERLIVYEYLPNKSLHTLLFDPDQKRELPLDWQTRYKIILGIALGLRYLHEESDPPIIHRDIKANNILLDKTLNPKIADFGLARLFPEDESHIQTRVAGTYGYMAPEYAMRGQLSMKADVYSFGVLVLEIVSGRKISDIDLPQQMQSLLEWAWRLYKQGCLLNMVDSTVSATCREEQAVRCIHVALLCTQADAGIRPTISNVIPMISSCSGTLPNPQKPAFVKTSESNLEGSRESQTSSMSSATTYSPLVPSVNNVTITELEAR